MEITDGKRTKVVHVNRLQPRIQPSVEEDVNSGAQHIQRVDPRHHAQWEAPTIVIVITIVHVQSTSFLLNPPPSSMDLTNQF